MDRSKALIENAVDRLLGEWGYRREDRRSPILPVGRVNLTTGALASWGNLFNLWEQNPEYTNILLTNGSRWYVVHTSGSGEGYNPGDTLHLRHDQNFTDMGSWEVVDTFPHTLEGIQAMKVRSGKSSLPFSTFK